jgi:glutaredoxin-like YruB-family protein
MDNNTFLMLMDIHSFGELSSEIIKSENSFLLLYKPESDNCRCAIENLKQISGLDDKNVALLKTDVTKTKEIHEKFGIDTVPSLLQFRSGELINVIKGCMTTDFYESVIRGDSMKTAKKDQPAQKRVIVYSTSSCPWCTRLKDHLRANNIKFEDVDVAGNLSRAEEMKRKSGQMGVPQTDIGGQIIVGFDKLKINTLLGIN